MELKRQFYLSVPVASLQDTVCKLLLPPLGKHCGFYFPIFELGIVDYSLVNLS